MDLQRNGPALFIAVRPKPGICATSLPVYGMLKLNVDGSSRGNPGHHVLVVLLETLMQGTWDIFRTNWDGRCKWGRGIVNL